VPAEEQSDLDDFEWSTKQHSFGSDERPNWVVMSYDGPLSIKRLQVPHLNTNKLHNHKHVLNTPN